MQLSLDLSKITDYYVRQILRQVVEAFKSIPSGIDIVKKYASPPPYVKGGVYFDTTLSRLRVGGATGWEDTSGVSGSSFGNLDGGEPDTNFGGIDSINCGGV